MTKRFRLLLVVGAGFLGLAFAAPALAAYEPDMAVQQSSYKLGASTTVGFQIFSEPTADATAKITIFSPNGYANSIGQTPGTVIGKAVAYVKANAIGGTILPLTGNVVVGNPSDPVIQANSQACRQSTTNQAVWVLDTTLQGQNIKIYDFVNGVSPYLVQEICLLSPVDPRNQFQAQLVQASFSVRGVFSNSTTADAYQWSADFTPYVPGEVTPNPAGTVEWRTFVGLPTVFTFKRVKSKSSVVTFAGKLSINKLNPTGIRLHLYSSTKPQPAPNFTVISEAGIFGRGKPTRTKKGLKANGNYSISVKRPKKKKTFFQMRFENYILSLPGGDACQGPSPSGQPIPCKGEWISPLTSNQVAVAPPRRKRR